MSYYLSPQFVLPVMACLVALEYAVLGALVIRDSRRVRRLTHLRAASCATYMVPNGNRINIK